MTKRGRKTSIARQTRSGWESCSRAKKAEQPPPEPAQHAPAARSSLEENTTKYNTPEVACTQTQTDADRLESRETQTLQTETREMATSAGYPAKEDKGTATDEPKVKRDRTRRAERKVQKKVASEAAGSETTTAPFLEHEYQKVKESEQKLSKRVTEAEDSLSVVKALLLLRNVDGIEWEDSAPDGRKEEASKKTQQETHDEKKMTLMPLLQRVKLLQQDYKLLRTDVLYMNRDLFNHVQSLKKALGIGPYGGPGEQNGANMRSRLTGGGVAGQRGGGGGQHNVRNGNAARSSEMARGGGAIRAAETNGSSNGLSAVGNASGSSGNVDGAMTFVD